MPCRRCRRAGASSPWRRTGACSNGERPGLASSSCRRGRTCPSTSGSTITTSSSRPTVLFAAAGFEPVRYFDQLLRSLDDLPSLDRAEIDGITITPWDGERSEEIRTVKNEAFADHWGSTPTQSGPRWESILRASTTRLDLSWLALDDDDNVIGYCINDRFEADDAVTGRKEAWIGNLGTLQQHRGRGIGPRALMIRSLYAFAAEGLDHAILGVDSDSPTGAPRLYRSLGFQPTHPDHHPRDSDSVAGRRPHGATHLGP